jgi:hypothetical protein
MIVMGNLTRRLFQSGQGDTADSDGVRSVGRGCSRAQYDTAFGWLSQVQRQN